jgi:tripartite-type tricarboxylate transporter receptor subunit TctC
VSQIVTFDPALAVNAQIPANDLDTLAAWIKANPQRGTFGSPGEGTGAHLAGLAFGRTFGLTLSHVPYRGTPAALPELITGQLPMFIASNAELITSHRRGQVRILATAGEARSAYMPDIPTFREQGVDVVAPGWFAFYAPAGVPQARASQLEKHIGEAMRLPATKALAESLSFHVSGTTAAELGRIQREQFERWGLVVKASGLAMR